MALNMITPPFYNFTMDVLNNLEWLAQHAPWQMTKYVDAVLLLSNVLYDVADNQTLFNDMFVKHGQVGLFCSHNIESLRLPARPFQEGIELLTYEDGTYSSESVGDSLCSATYFEDNLYVAKGIGATYADGICVPQEWFTENSWQQNIETGRIYYSSWWWNVLGKNGRFVILTPHSYGYVGADLHPSQMKALNINTLDEIRFEYDY